MLRLVEGLAGADFDYAGEQERVVPDLETELCGEGGE